MSKLLVALALIVAFSAPAVAAFGKAQSKSDQATHRVYTWASMGSGKCPTQARPAAGPRSLLDALQ